MPSSNNGGMALSHPQENVLYGLPVGYHYSHMSQDMRNVYVGLSLDERKHYNDVSRSAYSYEEKAFKSVVNEIKTDTSEIKVVETAQSTDIKAIKDDVAKALNGINNLNKPLTPAVPTPNDNQPQPTQDNTIVLDKLDRIDEKIDAQSANTAQQVLTMRNELRRQLEEEEKKRKAKQDTILNTIKETKSKALAYIKIATDFFKFLTSHIPQIWVMLATYIRALEDFWLRFLIPKVKGWFEAKFGPIGNVVQKIGDFLGLTEKSQEEARERVSKSKYMQYQGEKITQHNKQAEEANDGTTWGKVKSFYHRYKAIQAESESMKMAQYLGYKRPFNAETIASGDNAQTIADVKTNDVTHVVPSGDVVENKTEVNVYNNNTNNTEVNNINSNDSKYNYR